jgi:hypothetical protein
MSEQPLSTPGFSAFSAIPESSRHSSMELTDADKTFRAHTDTMQEDLSNLTMQAEAISSYALTESQEDLRASTHTRHPSLLLLETDQKQMPRSFRRAVAPKQHETAFSSFSYTNYSVLSELGMTSKNSRAVNEKESN